MAWYPGAERMELQPESDAQPSIRPTQLIIHSMAAPWTPRRLYEYWRYSTGLESHFGLGYDGSLAQYIGTQTRADANYLANRRPDGTGAVSVETTSNTISSDPWTLAQIEGLVKLGVWLHHAHGIPLRICRSWDDPGFGYHRMFDQWSSGGTACPGNARAIQFRDVVFPAIVARATNQEEEDAMPDLTGLGRRSPLTVQGGAWDAIEWDTEWVDEPGSHGTNGSRILHGPARFTGEVDLTLDNLPAGASFYVRLSEVDSAGAYVTDFPIKEIIGSGRTRHVKVPITGRVSDGHGIRVRVTHGQEAPVTISVGELKMLSWR